jgi:serpin B
MKATPSANASKDVAVSRLARIANPQVVKSEQDDLSAGNRAFSAGLYQKLRTQDGNLIFSPYSISLALAMTYGGAQAETARQMVDAMHFSLPAARLHPAFNALDLYLESLGNPGSDKQKTPSGESGQDFQLSIANSIWGQKDFGFLPAYLDLLAQNYGAGLRLVDFAGAPEPSRQVINAWVSQQTKDRIKDLFPQGTIDENTRLALVNAIYFKASWLKAFYETNTSDGIFNLKDGGQVKVPMMVSGSAASSYEQGDGFQAVGLPYLGETTRMVVVLPDEGQFDAFEAGLNPEKLDQILNGLSGTEIELTLPKFKIESSFNLSETLAGMGMPDAFDSSKADFSGMDGQRDLFISQVVHKAYVSVDEKGTEAAAATGVAVGATAIQNPAVLIVDRPFLFFIYEQKSGTILFAGRVMDPTK